MVSAKLLAQYGFLSKTGKQLLGGLSTEQRRKFLDKYDGDISKLAAVEMRELHSTIKSGRKGPSPTGYPKSSRSYRLTYENYSMSIEEMYYWVLNQITVDHGYNKENVIKITDIFSASEMSSYWGISAQRLSIQQDRVSQYLKFIADMIKAMFQLIRDLNIVDEKLAYYEDSYSDDDSRAASGDMVLKGQYTDLVEGGPKNPSSIFGMAQNFNFATLPDLFFKLRAKGKKEEDVIPKIHDIVWNMEFGNDTLKNVLERKMTQYYRWKFRTYDQLKTYRKLYKSYLKQHYNNIKLYMNWVKPYLRNIRRLSPDEKMVNSAELISAFEGEMIEIELLAKKKVKGAYSVLIAHFDYRTVPQLEWVPGAQERRPVMVGRAEMNLKSYGWSEKDIENYQKMKDAENFELIKEIDSGIKEAMESIQENVMKYLNEKDDDATDKKEDDKKFIIKKGKLVEVKDENKGKASHASVFEPFIDVFRGIGELVNPFTFKIPVFHNGKSGGSDFKAAVKDSDLKAWLIYKFYKKAHGLLSW